MTEDELAQMKALYAEFELCLAYKDDKTAEAVIQRTRDLQFEVFQWERINAPTDCIGTLYVARCIDELDSRLHKWREHRFKA